MPGRDGGSCRPLGSDAREPLIGWKESSHTGSSSQHELPPSNRLPITFFAIHTPALTQRQRLAQAVGTHPSGSLTSVVFSANREKERTDAGCGGTDIVRRGRYAGKTAGTMARKSHTQRLFSTAVN
jgi:hypothetical protein